MVTLGYTGLRYARLSSVWLVFLTVASSHCLLIDKPSIYRYQYLSRRCASCKLTFRHNFLSGFYLEWAEWSTCTQTCGGGTRSRARSHSCNKPVDISREKCNTRPCAYWGGWTNYGPCSVSCGIGTRVRKFSITIKLLG